MLTLENYMNNLLEKLKKYLKEVLGVEISILPFKEFNKFPFLLVDTYTFYEMFFLNNYCLLMVSKDDIELTPNTIQKHWEQVAKQCDSPRIYVSNTISSYNRKRLIQHQIPFIIPNNQIYIPDLGLDLREHFKQQRVHKQLFSPATQTVIISALLQKKSERLIPSELAAKLGYSHMTMTRAFNDLETAGIGTLINKGKERWWIFEGSKRDLWEQTKEMLRSPIKSRESMKLLPGVKMPQIPLAGMSALAEMTMINPPQLPIYAMGIEDYRKVNMPKGFQLSSLDEAKLELEIWHYNPTSFSEHERVDPFSLYLSLRNVKDERIEAALEELMEKIIW